MPVIHPTATIDGEVQLADDVHVGPHCVLTGPLTVGAGTHLIGNVYITGPATIGRDNTIYPFTCLGFAPQHARFDPDTPGPGLIIGDENTFRESVTIHRAFTDEHPTRIGHRNLFMVNSHIGHDSQVGDDNTFVNGALIGGHVEIQSRVTVGGNACVHQFCRVGRGAMLSGSTACTQDVAPFFTLTSINVCGTMNLIGARRAGLEASDIDDIRWVYRTLCRRTLSLARATETLRERTGRPMVDEYIVFLEGSERGVVTARTKSSRGAAAPAGEGTG